MFYMMRRVLLLFLLFLVVVFVVVGVSIYFRSCNYVVVVLLF